MATMHDGAERIPNGSYVRVSEQGAQPHTYIGKVVGTDMGRSKYEIALRYPGWDRWVFDDGGMWAFPSRVTVISEDEALAVPTEP